MASEQSESILNKIIVGVAVATLPVIILYYLGFGPKSEPSTPPERETSALVPMEPRPKSVDYGKYRGVYTGITLNTTGHQQGDTYLDIYEIDNATHTVRMNAEWTNGLYGAGRLFGKITNGKMEVQGSIYSNYTGGWDMDMEIKLSSNPSQLEGTYKLFPLAGNINGTQYGQFTLFKQR